jgi:Zn-dependent protease
VWRRRPDLRRGALDVGARRPHSDGKVSNDHVLTAPAEERTPPSAEPPKRSLWRSLLAGGALLAFKAKSGLALLKLASLGKFALTGLSMAAMVWFEAQRGGFPFAIGFVLLILIHELGHALAIRRLGLRSGWPVFIPFFGAMIALKEMPKTRADEALIAYGGPLLGTLASAALAGVFLATGSRLCLSLAYTGFILNLFNLIPISPLDGGRVAQIFSRRAWIVGGLLLGAMFLATMTPQLLLIAVLAATHSFRRREDPMLVRPASAEERSQWSVRYFGLCFFLGASVYFAHRLLSAGA